MIQQVESSANKMLESMPYGPDRDILKFKLADIMRRVGAVNEKSTERKDTLDLIQPLAEQYHDSLHAFLPYLDGAEEKLEALKRVPRDEERAAQHKADTRVMCKPRVLDVLQSVSFCCFQLVWVRVGCEDLNQPPLNKDDSIRVVRYMYLKLSL